MFDKLVESAKQKQGGRSKRLFLATGVIYAVTLAALGVATIIGFKSALAEEYDITTCLVPPVPSGPDPSPVQIKPNLKSAPDPGFVAPEKTTPPPDLDELNKLNLERTHVNRVPGAEYPVGIGRDGIPGAPNTREALPPPPPPKLEPTPTPTPVPKEITVSGGVLQGKGIKKIHPPYPPIARAAGASGAVSVQITISEEGRVIEAAVISGHPLLRDASLQAAKQWLFQPTKLSGVPVKVQGILTFNFTLN